MTEQIIQVLERKDLSREWKVRTVIQIWPNIPEERERLNRFLIDNPYTDVRKVIAPIIGVD